MEGLTISASERLFVRLSGENKSYQKALSEPPCSLLMPPVRKADSYFKDAGTNTAGVTTRPLTTAKAVGPLISPLRTVHGLEKLTSTLRAKGRVNGFRSNEVSVWHDLCFVTRGNANV